MFTGIISHLGRVKKTKSFGLEIEADRKLESHLKKGASVAINGVCLTVKANSKNNIFNVDIMPETFKKTALASLKAGDLVNLELPLTVGDEFAGHIVQGHVDGVGEVLEIKREGNSRVFKFEIPPELAKYIVPKGSIAINGISLTVIKAEGAGFKVGIIPHTWENTMIKNLKDGDKVNIEVDILAKYVEKIIKN